MLIKGFSVPEDEASFYGLAKINMTRLGKFVTLAGKNGSGKTRLLQILENNIQTRTSNFPQTNACKQNIIHYSEERGRRSDAPGVDHFDALIRHEQAIIARHTANILAIDADSDFKSIKFVPKNLNLMDPRSHAPADLKNRFTQAAQTGITGYNEKVFAYIQQSQNRYWECTHPKSQRSNEENAKEILRYNSLDTAINFLLGAFISRSADGEATIFDKPLAEANLSDGQNICLQLAVAIHAQESTLDNTVFLLDELENHLHPSAAIDLLEKLNIAAPNAQFWIATHSIPLLAYIHSIEPMALWYMDDGAVTHAGRHPEQVLRSLLGDEDRLNQLHSFTGLPAILATTNYAAECLLAPTTLPNEGRDPQIGQIAKVLATLSPDAVLSVLDYGAGKGRLLEGLAATNPNAKLSDRIQYFAFDQSPKDKAACLEIMAEHFELADEMHFCSEDDFFGKKDNGSIDVVVMCNVLHEIPPSQWLPLFSKGSLIWRALKDDGYLLLVEDQRIPVGEKAHEHGFLVLDTAQVRTLFAIKESDRDKFVADDYRDDGRLKAHLIGKSLLERISTETRKAAISELRDAAMRQARQIRQNEYSYTNGQLHGFWTQQFANTSMFMAENP